MLHKSMDHSRSRVGLSTARNQFFLLFSSLMFAKHIVRISPHDDVVSNHCAMISQTIEIGASPRNLCSNSIFLCNHSVSLFRLFLWFLLNQLYTNILCFSQLNTICAIGHFLNHPSYWSMNHMKSFAQLNSPKICTHFIATQLAVYSITAC